MKSTYQTPYMTTSIHSHKMLFFFILTILISLTSCNRSSSSVSQVTNSKAVMVAKTSPNSPNPLAQTSWRIDGNAFVSKERESYSLSPKDPDNQFEYGYFVDFKEDGSFHGYYTARCGNDCFTTIYGTYTMLNESQVKIFVKSVSQKGECNDNLSFKNREMGTFEIVQQPKKAFLLKRILVNSEK